MTRTLRPLSCKRRARERPMIPAPIMMTSWGFTKTVSSFGFQVASAQKAKHGFPGRKTGNRKRQVLLFRARPTGNGRGSHTSGERFAQYDPMKEMRVEVGASATELGPTFRVCKRL